MKIDHSTIIGFDTQILIWSLCSNEYRSNLDHKIRPVADAAASLHRYARMRKARIAISTITVAEYLAAFEEKYKLRELRKLETYFTIAAFNNKAALDAGRIFINGKTLPTAEKYQRKVLSADSKVIASLKAMRCSFFVSHDGNAAVLSNANGLKAICPTEIDTNTQTEFPFEESAPGPLMPASLTEDDEQDEAMDI